MKKIRDYLLVCALLTLVAIVAWPSVNVNAREVEHIDITADGGKWDKMHYYRDNGDMVRDVFFFDGEYTYYLQYDGTPMKDRFTYHPDGEHLIYFDEEGHEVFNDFHRIKASVTGEPVDDLCFFDVFGYLYRNVITYDKTGTKIYYANSFGVMEHSGLFKLNGSETNYNSLASGMNYGYANEDGTIAGFYENEKDYLEKDEKSCKVWMPVMASVYTFENGNKVLKRTEDFSSSYASNVEMVVNKEFNGGNAQPNTSNDLGSIISRVIYQRPMYETLESNGFSYKDKVVILNDLNFNDGDIYLKDLAKEADAVEKMDASSGIRTITTPITFTEFMTKDGKEILTKQYGNYGKNWSSPFIFYKRVDMDDKVIEKKYVEFYNGKYGPYVLVSNKGEMPYGATGNVGDKREVTFTRYDADWISTSLDNMKLTFDDDKNEEWKNPEEIVLTYEYCDLMK